MGRTQRPCKEAAALAPGDRILRQYYGVWRTLVVQSVIVEAGRVHPTVKGEDETSRPFTIFPGFKPDSTVYLAVD